MPCLLHSYVQWNGCRNILGLCLPMAAMFESETNWGVRRSMILIYFRYERNWYAVSLPSLNNHTNLLAFPPEKFVSFFIDGCYYFSTIWVEPSTVPVHFHNGGFCGRSTFSRGQVIHFSSPPAYARECRGCLPTLGISLTPIWSQSRAGNQPWHTHA